MFLIHPENSIIVTGMLTGHKTNGKSKIMRSRETQQLFPMNIDKSVVDSVVRRKGEFFPSQKRK